MNTEDFFDGNAGNKILRAYNVGCMLPYMDYTPRTFMEIVDGYEKYRQEIEADLREKQEDQPIIQY